MPGARESSRNVSPSEIVSPGLIDSSIKIMMPEMKVGDDLLQAETDTDAYCTGKNSETR